MGSAWGVTQDSLGFYVTCLKMDISDFGKQLWMGFLGFSGAECVLGMWDKEIKQVNALCFP